MVVVDFRWIGEEQECIDTQLDEQEYKFYKSFHYNDETYNVDDFAVIKTAYGKEKICKLLDIYETKTAADDVVDCKFRANVRWYTKAADIPMVYKNNIELDVDNEIIEDYRNKNTLISLLEIQRKCKVLFAAKEDPIYLIEMMGHDKDIYFSCRYRIRTNQLTVLSELDFEETALNNHDYTPISKSQQLIMNKVLQVKVVDTDISKGISKTVNITPQSLQKLYSLNVTPNRAKRNLNESFDNTPNSQTDSPVLNYSVVENEIDDNKSIKIKLRLSDKQKYDPKVMLKRLDLDSVKNQQPISTPKSNKVVNTPKSPVVALTRLDLDLVKNDEKTPKKIATPNKIELRRSSRATSRVSYADYYSPIKYFTHGNDRDTPSARTRSQSIDVESVPPSTPKSKQIKAAQTPKSTRQQKKPVQLEMTPSKKRRSTSVEIEILRTPPKKNNKTPKKSEPQQSPNKRNRTISGDSDCIILSPSKKNSANNTPRKSAPQQSPKKRNRLISTGSDCQIVSPIINVEDLMREKKGLRIRKVTINDDMEENAPPKSTTEHGTKNTPARSTRISTLRSQKYSECGDDEIEMNLRKILSPLKISTVRSQKSGECSEDEIGMNLRKILSPLKLDFNTKSTRKKSETPSRKKSIDTKQTPSRKKSVDAKQTPSRKKPVDAKQTPSRKKSVDVQETPTRKSSRKQSVDYENEISDSFTTPKKVAQKIPKTPKNTPGMRMKLIRDGVITPSMQSRQTAVVHENTPLNIAKTQLHVSYVPTALPCREKEFGDVLGFVEGKLLDGCGGCMYISGVPGTGKTATVTEVIKNLQEMSRKKELPKFSYVSINGMRLTEPRQSYVEIHKQLTGKTVPWEQAQSILENRFTKTSKTKTLPIVLLVDELDILCTKRQDVVYNLLDWPTKAKNQLIVITIANTMDLPERLLMGRVTSRLGLTRLTFQAYTHKQLQEIVMKRLLGTNAFNPDAVQLVARKVASVSGDARRALDICRRSAEIAEVEGPKTLVSMKHVNEALGAMITQPKVRAIKHCSRLEQLILQAIVAEVERTGVDETTFSDIFTMLQSVAGIDGFQMVSSSLALAAVSRLGSCRLLLTDQKSTDLYQKLILNVSADDIYYALRQD